LIVRFSNVQDKIDLIVRRLPGISTLAVISPYVAYALMVIGVWFLASNLASFFWGSSGFVAVTPVIPLVTIQSPIMLLYFFASIPILVIPHELAHAVVARLNKIELKGGGIAVIALLFAGFIEPKENSFKAADWKARVQVVSAGSVANLLIGGIVFAILLTQPYTYAYLPSSFSNLFYGAPQGILVVDIVKGMPASDAGLKPGDIILAVNASRVNSIEDYAKLPKKPGDKMRLLILRSGVHKELELTLTSINGRAVAGFYGITYRQPRIALPRLDRAAYSFLLWVSLFSLMVAIFNMLPLYPFDGGLYAASVLDAVIRDERKKRIILAVIYVFSALLLGGNIVASIIRYGLIKL